MGLGDAFRRKLEFYKHTHAECQNFDHGTCKVAHFTNLNPKETACPHFKAKQNTDK